LVYGAIFFVALLFFILAMTWIFLPWIIIL